MALNFYKEWAGTKVQAINSNGVLQTDPTYTGTGTQYQIKLGTVLQLTGWYYYLNGYFYLQTTELLYLLVSESGDPDFNQTTYQPSASLAQANKVAETIIANNKAILENNLLCARFASKLTASEKQDVITLQARLQERNQALLNNNIVSQVNTSSPPGYEVYLNDLQALNNSIGIVISTTAIVIACVIAASLATAAYYALKYYADQSTRDVKFSNNLTKKLTERLTEDEYSQLMQETQGLVTKAVVLNKLKAGGNTLLILGLAAGGFLLAKYLPGILK